MFSEVWTINALSINAYLNSSTLESSIKPVKPKVKAHEKCSMFK